MDFFRRMTQAKSGSRHTIFFLPGDSPLLDRFLLRLREIALVTHGWFGATHEKRKAWVVF